MVDENPGQHGQKSPHGGTNRSIPEKMSQPSPTFIQMDHEQWCEHKPVWVGRVAVAACEDCGQVDWLSDHGPVDPAEAMAALFGSFDLVGSMEALGAPSPEVLVYRPPTARKRRHLDALPRRAWLKAGPHLWMSTDGEVLLLSTNQPLLYENLTRGA